MVRNQEWRGKADLPQSMSVVFLALSYRQRVKVFVWTAASFLIIGLALLVFFQEKAISKAAPLTPVTGVIVKSLGASDEDRTIMRFVVKLEPNSASRQVFAPLYASGRCGSERLSVGDTLSLSVEARESDFKIRAAANAAGCVFFDDTVADYVRQGRQQSLRMYTAYFFGLSVLSFFLAFWYWRKV